ncbi:hypothetical protein M3J09_007046 [Ascochyta lentis]
MLGTKSSLVLKSSCKLGDCSAFLCQQFGHVS